MNDKTNGKSNLPEDKGFYNTSSLHNEHVVQYYRINLLNSMFGKAK